MSQSPILWMGDNGVISYCRFSNNSALNMGGAITWKGNNGVINASLFENNTAGIIGGAIHIFGENNTICNCIFLNCDSQIGGEAIYVDRNHKNCNISALYVGKKLITDGSAYNIDSDCFNYICESVFSLRTINLIPIFYSAIISNETNLRLNDDTTYYYQFSGSEFILTLSRTFDDGLTYRRGYHFFNVTDSNDVFWKLINGDYKNDFTFLKYFDLWHTSYTYEYVCSIKSEEIFSVAQHLIVLADLLTLEANSINDMSYQLEIDFGIGLRVDTKLTFNPSKNGFNVVNIIGHGSCICTKSGNRDENIWGIIDDDCIFFSIRPYHQRI